MSAPICHRIMQGFASDPNVTSLPRGWYAATCIGSRCALWAPAGAIPTRDAWTATTPPVLDHARGNCADNPFATPWADPAKDGAK